MIKKGEKEKHRTNLFTILQNFKIQEAGYRAIERERERESRNSFSRKQPGGGMNLAEKE